MPLNVAQYLAPLNSQQVLTGLTQGVKDGDGLTIAPDGTISLNKVEAAALGFIVSSGSPAPVFNWSLVAGTSSSILTNDGFGNARWATDYVQTFPLGEVFPHRGAAFIPTGTTAQRPPSAIAGFFRYNTSLNYLEWFNGSGWRPVSQSTGGVFSFVSATTPVPNAPGDFWYDTANSQEKVWTGFSWVPTAAPPQPVGFKTLDDISSLFNGILTSFLLSIGGTPYTPNPTSNLMVFLGGVSQIPGPTKSYVVSGYVISFADPPPAGTSFYATTVG